MNEWKKSGMESVNNRLDEEESEHKDESSQIM